MSKKSKKRFLASLLVGTLALVGCSSKSTVNDEVRTPPKELPIATIVVKDFGTIEAELYPHIAPNTVNNFISLANSGFYDGLTYHRIISGFMIQGGDPLGNGSGGSEETITGEFASNGVDNKLSHTRGAISMARSTDYNSARSQFFIVHEDSTFLDGDYAAFGYVTKGMDIVDKICADTPVQDGNGTVLPKNQPIIESIKVIK